MASNRRLAAISGCNRLSAAAAMAARAVARLAMAMICLVSLAAAPAAAGGAPDPLTPGERAWLQQHDGKIVVNNESGWPPIIDTDKDGNPFGIVIDYQRLIEKKLGFKFKLDTPDSWQNFMDRFRKGQIDVNNNLQKSPERTEFALFTKPYIEIPTVIIVRKDTAGTLGLENMGALRIAVTRDFAIHEHLKTNYGHLQLVPLGDDLHCLLETSTGTVDASVVNVAVASYIIEKMGITNLRIAGDAGYVNALSFAARKDLPVLHRILEKGLDLITPAERDAIYRKWISLGGLPFYRSLQFWVISGGVLAVFLMTISAILFWNRSLKRQVDLRTKKLKAINARLKTEISDRRQTEAALYESEEKFRTFVEKSPLGIALITHDGRYKYINPQFRAVFGYTMEDIPTGAEWFQKAFPDPQYRKNVTAAWIADQRKAGIGQTRPRIYTVTCKDGSRKEISFQPVTMENLDQFVVYEDVTEKFKIERQLQQTHKFEALGTLAGGIAHDFNNLLMGIQGRASLMSMDLDAHHPHLEHIQAIEAYIRSAAGLTRQLLGFARGGKYEVAPFDINALLLASATMFGRTRKEIMVRNALAPSPLVVEADRRQIEQVLLNLFVNAWQAMPGGGELCLETKTVALDEDYCQPYQVKPGPYAKISVTDTGIGMAESTRRRVFDPFFTTKQKSRGVGLGLASAYGIIKNHGGIITVYSEPGHGTTFNIYLQISDKAVHSEMAEETQVIKGSETILLVDDEPMIIDVGKAMLAKLGYRVIACDSGAAAIETLTDMGGGIDLVVLDLIMPGMDGGKTFDRIRAIAPQMPVILSSGYAISGQATEIMRRGCNGFIQKPFNISELSRKISQTLDETKAPTPRAR